MIATVERTDPELRPQRGSQCSTCLSTADLIVGDGRIVCHQCVRERVGVIVNPSEDSGLRDWLAELHADVVELTELPNGKETWKWTGWK